MSREKDAAGSRGEPESEGNEPTRPAPSSPGLPPPGSVLGGHRLQRIIGAGSQGVVFEAVELATGRSVAMKVLAPGHGRDERSRFDREIEILSRLEHPGIPPLFKTGVEQGAAWFTMGLVTGPTLVEHAAGAGLGPTDVVRLVAAICEAVAHAHARGVIHRDIKSDNIRMDEGGRPRVLDFGIAKVFGAATLTAASGPLGTVSHAAPELLWGDASKADVRADVYSLGVVLYRLLAGRLPLEVTGDLSSALSRLRDEEPAPPSAHRPGLSRELDAICLKCLSRNPGGRYESVLDLQRDLVAWLSGEPVAARGRAPGYRLRKALWRHRWLAGGVVVAFSALAALSASLAVQSARLRDERDRAIAEERKARALANAFTQLLEDVNPDFRTAGDESDEQHVPTAAELVDRMGRRATRELVADPPTRATVLNALGQAYLAIGLPARAVDAFRDACLEKGHVEGATTLESAECELGMLVAASWRHDREMPSLDGFSSFIGRLERLDASPWLLAHARLEAAEFALRRDEPLAALELAREARADWRRTGGDEDGQARAAIVEAAALAAIGALPEARDCLAQARSLARSHVPQPLSAFARADMVEARILEREGRIAEASELMLLAFAHLERRHGASHPQVVGVAVESARILSRAGRHEEAVRRLSDILRMQRIMHGEHALETRETLLALADEHERLGDVATAECLRAEAAITRRIQDLVLP